MRDYRWGNPPLQANPEQEQGQAVTGDLDWGENEWGTHRYHIRVMVERTLQELRSYDRVAVLGTGNHGDVHLPELASRFQQVTVIDSEANGIEDWAQQSGSLPASRIKSLTHVDYTKLDQVGFYETFEEMLEQRTPAEQLAQYLTECAYRVLKHEALPYLKATFSLVISSGTYTQLFYIDAMSRFAPYAQNYSPDQIGQIVQAITSLHHRLVVDYNKLVLSLLKPEGRVFVWSEMVQLTKDNEVVQHKLYALKKDKERVRELFRLFGEYGIPGAVLAIKDMGDRLQPGQSSFNSWIWHTDTGKTYLTAGLSGPPRA